MTNNQKPGFKERMIKTGVENIFIRYTGRIGGTIIGLGVLILTLGVMFSPLIFLVSSVLAILVPIFGIILIVGGIIFIVKMGKLQKKVTEKVVEKLT